MKQAKVLDTFPLVRFFKDEPGADAVEKLLAASRHGRLELLISEINIGELYYGIARKAGRERAESVVASLDLFQVTRLPTTWELVLAAARLKAEYALSYADCFAAACAIERQVALVTGDPEFKQVERLVSIEWV